MKLLFPSLPASIIVIVVLLLVDLVLAAETTTTTTKFNAHSDCPCLNTTDLFLQYSNCWVDEERTIPGIFTVLGNNVCYPIDYGSSVCDLYDLQSDPLCYAPAAENKSPPPYCQSSFCWVDKDKCRSSKDRYYVSNYFPFIKDLYWSYSTCDGSSEGWFGSQTVESTKNKTVTVALIDINYPLHYKKHPTTGKLVDSFSPEAFDDSIPWQGNVVDYFDAVVKFSNIDAVKYAHRSLGSTTKGHSSIFTQTVSDVQAGIVDLAVGSYWVTTERLAMTSFTSPISIDEFKLWIPQPNLEEGTFSDNTRKILMPFSSELWLLIFACIVVFAVLSALVSPDQFRRERRRRRPSTTRNFTNHDHHDDDGFTHNGDGDDATSFGKKIKHGATILTGALNSGFLDFMGGAVNYEVEANPAQKFLNFGFAFAIFITVTAYTANLAAFLTLSGAADYISSVRDATAHGVPICTLESVRSELSNLYPSTPFVYGSNFEDLFDAFDKGRCGAFVLGWVDVRGDPKWIKKTCDRNLVQVGEAIMEKMVAFPIRKELSAGLSHWLEEAESQSIFYDKSVVEKEDSLCSLHIALVSDNEEDSDLTKLTPANMVLPLTVFVVCCAMALIIHLGSPLCKRGSQNLRSSFNFAPLSSEIDLDDKTMLESSDTCNSFSAGFLNMLVPKSEAVKDKKTPSTARKSTRDADSIDVEDAMKHMQHMFAYQQRLLGRLKHLEDKETKKFKGSKQKNTQEIDYDDIIDETEC